jgi:hypothetical protein
MAANQQIMDLKDYFINGSNQSVLLQISKEMTLNYILFEDCMVPTHGIDTDSIQETNGNVQYIYKSPFYGVYVFSSIVVDGIYQTTVYFLNSSNFLEVVSEGEIIGDGIIQVAENNAEPNTQIGIVTGTGYYYMVDNVVTHVPQGTENFTFSEPSSIIMVDNIFFVSDKATSGVQATAVNNATTFQENVVFYYQSDPSPLISLARSQRVIYFIAQYGIERWTVTGGLQLLTRDSVYFESYGIYYNRSLSTKLNYIIGMFASNDGDPKVIVYIEGSDKENIISTPGIVERMLAMGDCISSDIYEIDSYIYYEIVFDGIGVIDFVSGNEIIYPNGYSFIYCFNNGKWTESTQPRNQVCRFNDVNYGAVSNQFFNIKKYWNDQVKYRIMPNGFFSKDFKNFTVGVTRFFLTNPQTPPGIAGDTMVQIGYSVDGTMQGVIKEQFIVEQSNYSWVTRAFSVNNFQFSAVLWTSTNVYWRAATSEIRYG